MKDNELISFDPDSPQGKPKINGLPYSVAYLLELLANGKTVEEILTTHKDLRKEHLQAACSFASRWTPSLVQVPQRSKRPTLTEIVALIGVCLGVVGFSWQVFTHFAEARREQHKEAISLRSEIYLKAGELKRQIEHLEFSQRASAQDWLPVATFSGLLGKLDVLSSPEVKISCSNYWSVLSDHELGVTNSKLWREKVHLMGVEMTLAMHNDLFPAK